MTMRPDELLQAVTPTIFRRVPEGTRLVGREVGPGIVMTDASAPGGLALAAARLLRQGVEGVIGDVGKSDITTSDFGALKDGVEAFFTIQLAQVQVPQVRAQIEDDQHALLHAMARALGMAE